MFRISKRRKFVWYGLICFMVGLLINLIKMNTYLYWFLYAVIVICIIAMGNELYGRPSLVK